MGASTFPLSDDVVALGDKIRGSPEIKIGKCPAEVGHEGLDVRRIRSVRKAHLEGMIIGLPWPDDRI